MAKFLRLIITLNLILMSALAWADTTKSTNTDYQLSSGDVISITVFAEPDLSFESLKLNDAGSFSYPFLGEVNAQGLTALQLQNKIAAKLEGDYLVNPKVSVSILEYRQFYISGEVKQPGGYPYQPGLTVRRATALAGGLTERASERRITIIREADKNKKPKYVSMEDRVMPGDTITIGQGFF
ncbi:polysaccharide biosynthesis/export family protein [Thiomicrorhabdus sp.]|uniref:polysaccharide biosynthesis/export family protein n=1 Tax=Thiomicrorhabdus sp. TaxID=2039724 RepID=UPI002AA83A95|nr:polysaccharide biosynthesis/export family protein [Thiomicrorhabdus sp.]